MNDISIGYILNIIIRRIWIIVLVAVLFGVVTFGYCSLLAKPVYMAKTSIIVTNGALIKSNEDGTETTVTPKSTNTKDNTVQSTDISASLNLVTSCVDVLKTDDIYKQIIQTTNVDRTAEALMKQITVAYRAKGSLFIDISVKSNSKQEAITLANAFAEASPEYIENIIGNTKIRVMTTADKAAKIAPRNIYLTLIATFLGAVISLIVIFIAEISDRSVKGPDDIINNYEAPFLGAVPSFENAVSGGYGYGKYGSYSYKNK